jgi:sugar lactone lactonase YvrE
MKGLELTTTIHGINGESPIWKPGEKSVYWVDTQKNNTYSYNTRWGRSGLLEVERPHLLAERVQGGHPRSGGDPQREDPRHGSARPAQGGTRNDVPGRR